MTEEQAIKIRSCFANGVGFKKLHTEETNRLADELNSAIKKQIPKKPDYEGDGYDEHGNLIYDTAYCPSCRHMFEVGYDATDYCPNCGQAIDWSDDE